MVSNISKPVLSSEQQVRPIGIVAFPGVGALDITGPHEVFTLANIFLKNVSSNLNLSIWITNN